MFAHNFDWLISHDSDVMAMLLRLEKRLIRFVKRLPSDPKVIHIISASSLLPAEESHSQY